MNGWPALDRFLRTDPRDVGCAEAMEMLYVYVDVVAAGEPAEQRYPGIAAHLRACGRVVRISRPCWPRCATTRANRRTRALGKRPVPGPRRRGGDRYPASDRGYLACTT